MININMTGKAGGHWTLGVCRFQIFRRKLSTTIDPESVLRGTTSETKMDGDEDDAEYRHPQLVCSII